MKMQKASLWNTNTIRYKTYTSCTICWVYPSKYCLQPFRLSLVSIQFLHSHLKAKCLPSSPNTTPGLLSSKRPSLTPESPRMELQAKKQYKNETISLKEMRRLRKKSPRIRCFNPRGDESSALIFQTDRKYDLYGCPNAALMVFKNPMLNRK